MGSLGALFYAVQMLSGIYRNKRDFHDAAYGGMAAGALLGLSGAAGRPAARTGCLALLWAGAHALSGVGSHALHPRLFLRT